MVAKQSNKRIDNILTYSDFSLFDDSLGNVYMAIPLPKGIYCKNDVVAYLTAPAKDKQDWIRTVEGGNK